MLNESLSITDSIIIAAFLILGIIFAYFGKFKFGKLKSAVLTSIGLLFFFVAIIRTIAAIPSVGTTLNTLSSLVAVFVSVIAVGITLDFKLRDSKDRQLSEIMRWAVDVQNFKINAPVSKNIIDYYPKTLEIYLSLLARGEYVRSLAEKSFKIELLPDVVNKVISNLVAVAYFDFIDDNAFRRKFRDNLRGKSLEGLNQVEHIMGTDDKRSLDQTIGDFKADLVTSKNDLFVKLGDITSNL